MSPIWPVASRYGSPRFRHSSANVFDPMRTANSRPSADRSVNVSPPAAVTTPAIVSENVKLIFPSKEVPLPLVVCRDEDHGAAPLDEVLRAAEIVLLPG